MARKWGSSPLRIPFDCICSVAPARGNQQLEFVGEDEGDLKVPLLWLMLLKIIRHVKRTRVGSEFHSALAHALADSPSCEAYRSSI